MDFLRKPWLIWVLLSLQLICGMFFFYEITASFYGLPLPPLRWQWHEIVELGASVGLIIGSFLGIMLVLTARQELARADQAMRMTQGQFTDAVSEYFCRKGLSKAETEIAWLLVKGFSLSDIAELRDTRQGTVKAQCASIYRKTEVSGKTQLVSQIVEDLLL